MKKYIKAQELEFLKTSILNEVKEPFILVRNKVKTFCKEDQKTILNVLSVLNYNVTKVRVMGNGPIEILFN